MNKSKEAEKLADILQGAFVNYTGQSDDMEIFLRMARYAIEKGYIHNSQAVDYCEVCKECRGSGKIYDSRYLDDPDDCPVCSGKGIVLITPRERKGG